MQVLAVGTEELLRRPCVDCGRRTGRYCDGNEDGECFAADRLPDEEWADRQLTPLCSECDNKHDMCHWCRGLAWCAAPPPVTKEGNKGKGMGKGKNKDAPTNFWGQPRRGRDPSYSDTDDEEDGERETGKGGTDGKGGEGKGASSNGDGKGKASKDGKGGAGN